MVLTDDINRVLAMYRFEKRPVLFKGGPADGKHFQVDPSAICCDYPYYSGDSIRVANYIKTKGVFVFRY